MRKLQLILVLLLAFILVLPAQNNRKKRQLKPIGKRKQVTTIINGKTRSYYKLDKLKPAKLLLRGPGELRVYTRARFSAKQKDKVSYKIRYSVDGAKFEEKKFKNVKRSKKAVYKKQTLGTPGQLKTLKIKLGDGHHSIEFYKKDKKIPVAARYVFIPAKRKKQKLISLTPNAYDQPVELISKESSISYYRFSAEKPLKFEIIGPTTARILTRIENHYNMRGRIHYRVQVKEKEKVKNTYQLSSIRSEVTTYKSDDKLVPGKAKEIVLKVPKGKHIYEIIPLDKDKSTILGRILFPQKDVNLEE